MTTDPTRREKLESQYTRQRVFELLENPVQGNFDVAHLKEVHRRIFQDLPALGITNPPPGKFREPVPKGEDWIKKRPLKSLGDGAFSFICYSPMEKDDLNQLDKTLQAANPAKLGKLNPQNFAKSMSELYARLDYVHPFHEGNSRTLRVFTHQLAKESGYELDWERHNASDRKRDFLYIARDREVGKLAFPTIRKDAALQLAVLTSDKYGANPSLQELLEKSIRPTRALAFEQLPEKEAREQHPELGAAFDDLKRAGEYYDKKMPDKKEASMQAVKAHIQTRLNEGETQNFTPEKQDATKAEPTKAPSARAANAKPKEEPEPERER
jgi:cell filamentation protein